MHMCIHMCVAVTCRRPAICSALMPCLCHRAKRQISSLNSGSAASSSSVFGSTSSAPPSSCAGAKIRKRETEKNMLVHGEKAGAASSSTLKKQKGQLDSAATPA